MEAGGPEDGNGKCHLRGHKITFEAVEMLSITLNKCGFGANESLKRRKTPSERKLGTSEGRWQSRQR